MRRNGHIRQRSEGVYEIRYDIGINPLTGGRRRLGVTIKGTHKDAERELRRLLHTIDTGEHPEPTKITVEQHLLQWLETIHSQLSPRTHERYTEIVKLFLVPAFGDRLLTKLTPTTIQSAYNAWETSGRRDSKEGGLSPRTRLHIHRVFKSALKHAVQLQIIVRNPADAIKPPRPKKTTITTLTIEQSATLLNALNGTRLYWPVLLALSTGMRRGEILALRWKNIDFKKATARVVESLEITKKGIRFKAPKTEKTRAIILPDYAVEELRAWKERQAKELEAIEVEPTQETLVCARSDGEPLWPTSVTHEFIKAIRKLPNLPRVRFHDLRHSHATQLLTAGIHPKIAQERLGHSTITTTLDLYSHVTDTMQGEAASKLDTAFRSAIKAKLTKTPQLG
ncbi:MAG: tyrosine-type recombinase/integrase [Anaerolineaceae bacterium]|nr:tyrosine-type recombinase/integrase [Anaerolineaceae bacterium]